MPWNRIHRTEQFILHPPKVTKAKTTRARTAKPKVKKLTKKAIQEKLNGIVFKQATGETLTDEEQVFFTTHTKGLSLL